MRQRSVDARNPNDISTADQFLDACGPSRIGGIGRASENDLAANEASPSGVLRCKTGGDTEADYGLAALGGPLPGEVVQSGRIVPACDGSDASRPRRNARLGTQAARGNDEARPLVAHIPAKTEVVLAALRLR